MQFELLRLSVLPRDQVDSFERQKPDRTRFTREEWIRAVFAENIEFTHRKESFLYAASFERSDGGPIFGRIGRKVSQTENDPNDNLKEVEHQAWLAGKVFIDPQHHADGQKVGVEHKPKIGKPIPLFESLVNKINAGVEPYFLEANAIVPSESFWNFVRKNDGKVVSIEFEFVAPNMFGGADDYDKEMREMQAHERAQRARLIIEGRDGLNLNTEKVKAAASYAMRGTGSIRARTKAKQVWASKAKAQRVSVTNKQISDTPEKDLLRRMFEIIFGK